MIAKIMKPGNRLKDFIKCRSSEKRYFVFDSQLEVYLNEEAKTKKEIEKMLESVYKLPVDDLKQFLKNTTLILQPQKSFII